MSSLEVGLVGLPNSGKSTVFNALTGAGAAVAPHMFSTVETNSAEAEVRDPRLADLARLSDSAKVVAATLRVVDIAGLVRGASHGEGLGNQFLGQIRSTDAVIHVVRCFRDESVAHPGGSVDPQGDVETVELELAFADLAAIERRHERVAKTAKGGDRDAVAEVEAMDALRATLEAGRPARSAGVDVPAALDLLQGHGIELDPMTTSYFLSRATVVPTLGAGMAPWREKMFASMHRNAASAADFLNLPPNRVVELGTKVQI